MDIKQLIDPLALAIVLGGTIGATLLRCGLRDTWETLIALAHLPRRAFDAGRVKSELAQQIQEIGTDGLLRVEPHHSGDGEFDDLADTLIARRSVKALYERHRKHREGRAALAETAANVLGNAAELAPVLGLAGTLLSLGGLSGAVAAQGGYGLAIGTAVTTTFYGLVLANFVFAPLGAAVERRARAEEAARDELLDWLALAVERACAPRPAAPRPVAARKAPVESRRTAA